MFRSLALKGQRYTYSITYYIIYDIQIGYLGAVIFQPPIEDNFSDLVQDAMCLFEIPTLLSSFPHGKV
jgi:hypothetical protein